MKRSKPSASSLRQSTPVARMTVFVHLIVTIEFNRICAIGLRSDLLHLSGKNHFGPKLNRLPERALTEVVS
ncbi:hypothetical protein [Edaphobacter aggregans]|uniref:hypothetical protein n=1 Tax=Edaphobacter aggregans TaxID=570835 RepID=UPI0012F7FB23|nr:hypothetical protein [Edaphobacter aggregans]